MREPMTGRNALVWMCMMLASATISISIIWATIHFAVPPIRERFQEFIEWLYPNPLSWTTGIIQESPTPRRVEYANHVEYVWE